MAFRDDVKPEIYYYAENFQELKPAFSRPLHKVLPRLELLGYSLANCRRMYEEMAEGAPDFYPDPEISFDMLARVLASVDVTRMGLGDDDDGYDLGEYAAKVILADPEFTKNPSRPRFTVAARWNLFRKPRLVYHPASTM